MTRLDQTVHRNGRWSGRTLGGRFLLGELVEQGPSWEAYEGRDISCDLTVAVSVLNGRFVAKLHRVEELVQEIQVCDAGRHPNLARLRGQYLHLSVRRKKEPAMVVWEPRQGDSLDTYIQQHGPLDPGEAAFVMLQVAAGQQALGSMGLAPRCISPRWVRLRPEHRGHDDFVRLHLPLPGGSLLSDVVRALETGEGVQEEVTSMLPYAPPEGLLDEAPGQTGPVFIAGALLYLALTGLHPVPQSARTMASKELRDSLLFRSPPPISSLLPHLPGDLAFFVGRTLARDPDDRPRDLTELVGVLSRLAPEPLVQRCDVKPPESPRPVEPPVSRTPQLSPSTQPPWPLPTHAESSQGPDLRGAVSEQKEGRSEDDISPGDLDDSHPTIKMLLPRFMEGFRPEDKNVATTGDSEGLPRRGPARRAALPAEDPLMDGKARPPDPAMFPKAIAPGIKLPEGSCTPRQIDHHAPPPLPGEDGEEPPVWSTTILPMDELEEEFQVSGSVENLDDEQFPTRQWPVPTRPDMGPEPGPPLPKMPDKSGGSYTVQRRGNDLKRKDLYDKPAGTKEAGLAEYEEDEHPTLLRSAPPGPKSRSEHQTIAISLDDLEQLEKPDEEG